MPDFRVLVDNILTHGINTFGEPVVFFPKCGGVYNVRGVFDNNYEVLDAETEQIVSANQPALGLNLNDLKFKLKVGDEVEFRATRWRVSEKKEDGQGGVVCLLHALKVENANRDTKVNKT